MWTPGPVELIVLMLALLIILINIAVIRWIYRINEFLYWAKQIHQSLQEISESLKK